MERVLLQYEYHLLLQVLQSGEQGRLYVVVVTLVVDLSRSHGQNVVVVHAVELHGGLGVALLSLILLFIYTARPGGGDDVMMSQYSAHARTRLSTKK